jgi:hypothetical protein
MLSSVENDLAKAYRRWTEKKGIAVPTGLTVNWRLSDKQAIIVNQYPGSTEKRVAGALYKLAWDDERKLS